MSIAVWVRDAFGFAIGGVAPVGHLTPPRHALRTSARELADMNAGTIADIKE